MPIVVYFSFAIGPSPLQALICLDELLFGRDFCGLRFWSFSCPAGMRKRWVDRSVIGLLSAVRKLLGFRTGAFADVPCLLGDLSRFQTPTDPASLSTGQVPRAG